jgi:hypothetical protein
MASSPVLPEDPRAFAGDWTLTTAAGDCVVRLSATPAPEVGGWTIAGDRACLAARGMARATAWRPDTDGLALVAADRSTVAFFSREASGAYVARRPGGERLTLSRASAT